MMKLLNWYPAFTLPPHFNYAQPFLLLTFQIVRNQMEIRKQQNIHSRSAVKILEARSDLYSAIIDGKLCMKIGEGSWCPSDPEWRLAACGHRYAVWHK
jgi:hypothetical protein